jgi:hypothetical protein
MRKRWDIDQAGAAAIAAQPGAVADAAPRRQDRFDFDGWIQLDSRTGL